MCRRVLFLLLYGANRLWKPHKLEDPAMASRMSARELYERGRVLKHANMYDEAVDDFQHAACDPQYLGKAQAQLALCFRAMGRQEEAVAAFRQALESSTFSSDENLHLLYLLGETLESLGHTAEALEAYGWVRQEDPGFRDVVSRIKHLCAGGPSPATQSLLVRQFRVGNLFKIYGHLRRRSLSLLEQTRQALTQSTGNHRVARSTPQAVTSARRTNPVASASRPMMARQSSMVMRQHVRVAIQGRSQFSSKSQKMAGEGQLRDLSPGGCRVTSSILVPVGTELVCWIFPHNNVHPVAIEGATVRWSHAQEFGLAFTHIQPAAQRQLAQLCANPI
jgi:tetratricopeptide (TPR) repeat protein